MKAAGGGRPSLTSIEAAPDEFLNPVCLCVCALVCLCVFDVVFVCCFLFVCLFG